MIRDDWGKNSTVRIWLYSIPSCMISIMFQGNFAVVTTQHQIGRTRSSVEDFFHQISYNSLLCTGFVNVWPKFQSILSLQPITIPFGIIFPSKAFYGGLTCHTCYLRKTWKESFVHAGRYSASKKKPNSPGTRLLTSASPKQPHDRDPWCIPRTLHRPRFSIERQSTSLSDSYRAWHEILFLAILLGQSCSHIFRRQYASRQMTIYDIQRQRIGDV